VFLRDITDRPRRAEPARQWPAPYVKISAISAFLCYDNRMLYSSTQPTPPIDQAARERRLEMQHLQAIEGNPLTANEAAMFDMFEREGWSHERRRAHILGLFQQVASPEAAE